MKLTVSVQPTAEPIVLSDIKSFLHMEAGVTDEDSYLTLLITAARAYCEGYQKKAYMKQTLKAVFDTKGLASPWSIELPRSFALQSVSSVKMTTGATTTNVADFYVSDDIVAKVVIEESGLTADSIAIEYVTGVDSADNVPAQVKQAMRMLIAHWFENRSAVTMESVAPKELPLAVKSLLDQGRVM